MAYHKNFTGFNTAHSIQWMSPFPTNSEQILHPSIGFPISAGGLPEEQQSLSYEGSFGLWRVLSLLTGLINH